MRGIFSMLFGAGTFLLISRLEQKNNGLEPADIYFRRLWWLLIFGLIDAYIFLWFGDILFQYAITALFFFPFRNLKPWKAVAFAVVFAVLTSIQTTMQMYESAELRQDATKVLKLQAAHKPLTDKQKETLKKWTKNRNENKPDTLKLAADSMAVKYQRNGYLAQQKEIGKLNSMIFFEWHMPNGILESLAFMLFGLAFFKWNILTGKRKYSFYAICALLGYAVGLSMRIIGTDHALSTGMDFTRVTELWPFDVYEISRLTVTLGHISFICILFKSGLFNWLLKPLANVGQMAFTNYLSQSLICTFIFFGYGLGMYAKLERYQTYEVVAAVWVFQLIFSTIWMRYFLFGPFEWVWRSLTYWERQPMLRPKA